MFGEEQDLLDDDSKMKLMPMRFASISPDDNQLKIWEYYKESLNEKHKLPAGDFGRWVTDVAWCQILGVTSNVIATSADDGSVTIWKEAVDMNSWTPKRFEVGSPAWRISWS